MHKTAEILLIAGEASGDVLGAELITALQKIAPDIKLSAMGGPKMAAAGADLLVDSRRLAVMGVGEALLHFFAIRKAYIRIRNYLKREQPPLVILIDYPGFNLRLAKVAHALDIKVLYYVSPKIWASRYQRIKAIKQYVDHMVVFFKFEAELYQREAVPVSFVAHPLTKLTLVPINKAQICQTEGLDPEQPIIALLPGSRRGEISRLMPLLCASKKIIQQQVPSAQFIIPLASSLELGDLQKYLAQDKDIKILEKPAFEFLSISNAAIVASGTATLEAALAKTPLVIVYKGWEYRLVKHLIKTPYVGLCNIAAQKMVVRELIEYDAKPEIVAKETLRLLNDQDYRQNILQQFENIPNQLGKADAASTVARLALEMLG